MLKKRGIRPPSIPVLGDPRRSLTLYYDLPPEARNAINEQILGPAKEKFKELGTTQVVFKPSWLHVPLLVIKAAEINPPFDPEKEDVAPYRKIAEEVLAEHHPFDVFFSRLVPFPEGILLGGFPHTFEVDEIRKKLREQIDGQKELRRLERRPLQIFHATLARWQTAVKPEGTQTVLEFISARDGSDIWKGKINQVTLAVDGYNPAPENTKAIETFTLSAKPF